jgi:hypothetical protein
MKKEKLAETILNHPDRETIISKLIAGVSCAEITEWLSSAYTNPEEEIFVLSEKTISLFKDNYLNFYSIMKEDLAKLNTKKQSISPSEELHNELDNNLTYKNALEKYANSELDIRVIGKRVAAAAEARLEQFYDAVQLDVLNLKYDRTLIEWFNTMLAICERFNDIQTGNIEQTNIQNNINITVVDTHINAVYSIIKEILTMLDYDTSLIFIEMFNQKMSELKLPTEDIAPIEDRLQDAHLLENTISVKLNK